MPEFRLDHIDIPSASPADPGLGFSLPEGIWSDLCTPWSNDKSLPVNPITTVALQISRAVLPVWATRYAIELQNLPWFQFHALVHPLGMLA